ncbi:phospholipase A(2) [Nephila pilipes]|uniref:Phospholipase A2 n=1 Tax=Nephila pilipes TaxID=299642 RepID=A0A8X6TY43_NEPPI|nr:phospholipase A(2) [Nephila pilipes]
MASTLSVIAVLCLGLLLTSVVGDEYSQKGSFIRKRRSLMNLSTMVSEVTGRESTDFVSYGNYCGLGGSGAPVDSIDQCCQIHDLCYNLSTKSVCHSLGEKGAYQVEYKWTKNEKGLASCAPEILSRHIPVKRDGDVDKCKTTICLCDAMLTNCLKDNLKSYNSQNLHKLSLFDLIQEANYVSEP